MKITVHIIPNASKNEIAGRLDDGRFRVKVQASPVEGAANKVLIAFIAKTVGVSKSKVHIISGMKSRDKVVDIDVDEEKIFRCLEGENEKYR